MSFIAAVTQADWISALKTYGSSGEVNFWRPGRQPLSAVHFGSPMLFVQKGKNPRLISGSGVIDRYETLSIRDAWIRWRNRNGVLSLEEFVAKLTRVAQGTSTNGGGMTNHIEGADTRIGCVVLKDVSWFPDAHRLTVDAVLPDFPRNVVSYKSYSGELPALLAPFVVPAAGRELRTSGRRPVLDPAERDAIEQHAMRMCGTKFPGWDLVDVSKPALAYTAVGSDYPGYDVLVRHAAAEYHVEVKGTKLDRPVITITYNELQTALDDPFARLLVVSGIRTYQEDEGWHAVGGRPALYKWAAPGRLKTILDGLKLGDPHRLQPKAVEWNLDIHSTDLLQADTDDIGAGSP